MQVQILVPQSIFSRPRDHSPLKNWDKPNPSFLAPWIPSTTKSTIPCLKRVKRSLASNICTPTRVHMCQDPTSLRVPKMPLKVKRSTEKPLCNLLIVKPLYQMKREKAPLCIIVCKDSRNYWVRGVKWRIKWLWEGPCNEFKRTRWTIWNQCYRASSTCQILCKALKIW